MISRTSLQVALLLIGIAIAAAGCGGQHKVSIAHGREIYQNGANGNVACSFCHTMRAANSDKGFAANLDTEFSGDRSAGWSDARISKKVSGMIDKGLCLDPKDPSRCMPADLVSGANAADVTAFVTRCAGLAEVPSGCLSPMPASALAKKGQSLFGSLRCSGCHSTNGNVAMAPTFKGLAGSQVELTNGQKVKADDDYLSVAILAPDAQIVKDYKPGFMSSVVPAGSVSAAQVKALIAYIKTLK